MPDVPSREELLHGGRNKAFFDAWTIVHVLTGIAAGWLMHPFWALAILILWEPLEIFVLHPVILRVFHRVFGYESWENSLSDILFDMVGVGIGYYGLRALVDPPFVLFG